MVHLCAPRTARLLDRYLSVDGKTKGARFSNPATYKRDLLLMTLLRQHSLNRLGRESETETV